MDFTGQKTEKTRKNSGRGGANEHGRRGEAKESDGAKQFFTGMETLFFF
jgi:hypothetical protein